MGWVLQEPRCPKEITRSEGRLVWKNEIISGWESVYQGSPEKTDLLSLVDIGGKISFT